jgi:hypothetical protein
MYACIFFVCVDVCMYVCMYACLMYVCMHAYLMYKGGTEARLFPMYEEEEVCMHASSLYVRMYACMYACLMQSVEVPISGMYVCMYGGR